MGWPEKDLTVKVTSEENLEGDAAASCVYTVELPFGNVLVLVNRLLPMLAFSRDAPMASI